MVLIYIFKEGGWFEAMAKSDLGELPLHFSLAPLLFLVDMGGWMDEMEGDL